MSIICRSLFPKARLTLSTLHHALCHKRYLTPTAEKHLPIDLSLYLVANRPSFEDEKLFFAKIIEAVKGGASCVQLRDHKSDFATTIKTATQLKKLLQPFGTALIINTLNVVEVARLVNADGVFLEQDISPFEVRRQLGKQVTIGVPVRTLSDVVKVVITRRTNSIDHLSVKIAPSKRTCPRNDQLWNMAWLRIIRYIVPHRIVAIGGLNLARAESVYKLLNMTDGIAMAGGLLNETDPYSVARQTQAIRQKVFGHALRKQLGDSI